MTRRVDRSAASTVGVDESAGRRMSEPFTQLFAPAPWPLVFVWKTEIGLFQKGFLKTIDRSFIIDM